MALVQEYTDVYWLLTPTGEMPEPCLSWQAFTGQTQQQSMACGWLDAVHPAERSRLRDELYCVVTTGQAAEIASHIRRGDGTYRLIRVNAIPVHEDEHAISEVMMCGRDITEPKDAGQVSVAQVQLTLDTSGVGMWDWDIVSNQIVWNDQQKALFGFPPTACITYQRFLDAVHPADRGYIERFRAGRLNERSKQGQGFSTSASAEKLTQGNDFRVIWPDGSIHWLKNRVQVLSDALGRPTHVVGATIDITYLKQAEEALHQSQERLLMLVETIPQLVWIARPDGYHEYFNRRCFAYFNASFEQLAGDQWVRMLHPDDRQRTLVAWHTALQTGQAYEIENRLCNGQTGEYQWFLVRAIPLADEQGHVLKWFGTCTNIDKQKRAEEALRESDVRFRALMESNLIGINVSDLQGTIREANDAYLSFIGYTREDLAAGLIHWPQMTPPEHMQQSLQSLEELLTHGTMQPFEKEYIRKDGKRVPLLLGSTLLRQKDAEPLLLTFVLDLTAHKELERQKDLMLGMTSHELKTPLAALRGTFQLVQRRAQHVRAQKEDLSPEVRIFLDSLMERLTACVRQVDIQTHLINDLLDVSRITANSLKLDLTHCDLVPIVHETVTDLRATEPERTLLLTLPENMAVNVCVDRNRISQVVTNYVTNALRYSSAEQPVRVGLTMQDDVARVWVRDQGPGLTKEAQAGLWRRFSQIKGIQVQNHSEKGLGLGLYICQTLIAQHQGEVGVESTPGEGSTFWFTLPLAPEGADSRCVST